MKLTNSTRRMGLRAGRLLTTMAISILCFACLTISTFSFELRSELSTTKTNAHETGDQAFVITEPRSSAQEPTRVTPVRVETERALIAGNAQQRAQAACDAGKRGAVEAIPQLVSLLGDDTRVEALKCWNFAEAKWNPALDTFKYPSPGEQAAIALASMGSPAFEVLTSALGSGDSTVRRNAAWAIGELTNMAPDERRDAVMPLIALLGDGDSWVRMAAARALGELRDERAGERLIGGLLDSEAGVMKDERAVQTLCLMLISDARSEVRLATAEALGEIRSQKALVSLNQALNDAEPRVRAKVRWAIAEIEDSDG